MMTTVTKGAVLRPNEAAKKLAIGLSTFWLKVKTEPDFPKTFKLGPRTTVVYDQDCDDYIAACRDKSAGVTAAEVAAV